jgi:hypothetical protein
MDREITDLPSEDAEHEIGFCRVADAVDSKCKPARAGWGHCSACECEHFMGNDELCGNCHHNYSLHD